MCNVCMYRGLHDLLTTNDGINSIMYLPFPFFVIGAPRNDFNQSSSFFNSSKLPNTCLNLYNMIILYYS